MKTLMKKGNEVMDELLFHRGLCQDVLAGGNVRSLYSWLNGETRYYAEYHDGIQKTLGRKDPYVEELQERLCAREILKALNHNIFLLDELLTKWKPCDPNEMEKELPTGCKDLSTRTYESLGFIDRKAWAEASYTKSDSFPENLIHQTRSGLMVRSRAEVIIADTYDELGIPYRYEAEYELPNGVRWFADFTLLLAGQIKGHEHFGNLKNPDSLQRFLWKEQQCIMNGVIPYHDILFTFDGYDGEINTRYLYKSIQQFLAI